MVGENLEFTDANGRQISLHDIDADFKLLYFYSTTCENCKKETPNLVQVYREWKNRGVEVIAFCMDEDEQAWRNYIQQNQMTFINTIDPDFETRYNFKYHADITPELYILTRENKIIGKDLKAFQVPEIINRELGKS